ncbi:hypothetical protein L596_016318 [Steinernema carpocapsae]|uniref:Uncharacterized protein n=1 Tax=Steinernema carpocapsae TaxID=34508 RepID=A0A4U5NIF1_STECR|nr:hypothetical protein L596_016318 [Steinernema carpocapsae]
MISSRPFLRVSRIRLYGSHAINPYPMQSESEWHPRIVTISSKYTKPVTSKHLQTVSKEHNLVTYLESLEPDLAKVRLEVVRFIYRIQRNPEPCEFCLRIHVEGFF